MNENYNYDLFFSVSKGLVLEKLSHTVYNYNYCARNMVQNALTFPTSGTDSLTRSVSHVDGGVSL